MFQVKLVLDYDSIAFSTATCMAKLENANPLQVAADMLHGAISDCSLQQSKKIVGTVSERRTEFYCVKAAYRLLKSRCKK